MRPWVLAQEDIGPPAPEQAPRDVRPYRDPREATILGVTTTDEASDEETSCKE